MKIKINRVPGERLCPRHCCKKSQLELLFLEHHLHRFLSTIRVFDHGPMMTMKVPSHKKFKKCRIGKQHHRCSEDVLRE
jgi:hypothetical protein